MKLHELGKALKKIRKDMKLSQVEAGLKYGFGRLTVCAWENNETAITKSLEKYIDQLGYYVDVRLLPKDEMHPDKIVYNKALDDFSEELRDSPIPFTCDLKMFDMWIKMKTLDMKLR